MDFVMPLKQQEKNNSSLLQIVFDGERMKYPNTGLFAFCKFLGAALLQRKEIVTTIYQDINASSVWMNRPKILEKKFWHKWWMPNLNQYHLWHATYQGTNYFPFSFKGKILLTIHDINFMHENKSDKKKEKYLAKLQEISEKIQQQNPSWQNSFSWPFNQWIFWIAGEAAIVV
jgi:hypothetical protein